MQFVPTPQAPQVSKKTQQYIGELEELNSRYQYSLVPTLDIKNSGITPTFRIADRIPPKGGKPVQPKPIQPKAIRLSKKEAGEIKEQAKKGKQ